MYARRSRPGARTYRFFEPDMDARVKARRMLETRSAPGDRGRRASRCTTSRCVSLRDDAITGCEALLRWRHPERGMISPAEFIPIAEETGLINQIGEWVLTTACAEAATWPDDIKLAVNVSPVQFKSGTLALKIVAALAASGLPASRLELEITEAVLIRDDEAALAILHQLRAHRGADRARRFRHRLFLAELSAALSVRQDQDRPLLRQRHRRAGRLLLHRAGGGQHRRRAPHDHDGGRRRDPSSSSELLRTLGCSEMQGYLFSQAKPAAAIRLMLRSPARTPDCRRAQP